MPRDRTRAAQGPAQGPAQRPARRPAERAATPRRRASHSMEAVLTDAVALLDEAGEPALTFRALAARLRTGVGTIYWYVASKEELLDRATDFVLTDVLHSIEEQPQADDPVDALRAAAVTLFDAVVERPWLGAYFMRNTEVQGNSLRLYERLGQQTLRLDLTARQRFHAVSAVVGFVVGTAADMGQEPPQEVIDRIVDRETFMNRAADSWAALDPADYPFLHEILDEFRGHDDADQFRAGLELILSGLRQQAGG